MRFQSFEELLRHWAEASPSGTALCGEGTELSFRDLLERVLRRADELKQTGKSCLGLLSDGSVDCVTELFAANLAGLQVVMLDESAPEAVLRGLIAYTDVDLLWGDRELCEELEGSLTRGVADGKGKILFFTSGTTERAKAVVLTDRSLCQSAWNGSAKLPLQPEDRLLCMLPLGHVFGFVCGLLWGLSCGAAVALGRGARHYLDDMKYFRPTAVSLVPRLLGFLLQQGCMNDELKLILVGAGDCPPQLLQAVQAMGIRLSFGYGLTETSSGVAISVGGDPYAMEICPDDTVTLAPDGEILIQAPTCMMQGYYKWPQYTEQVLHDGVLSTGDLGFFDENGRLHVTGRKKDNGSAAHLQLRGAFLHFDLQLMVLQRAGAQLLPHFLALAADFGFFFLRGLGLVVAAQNKIQRIVSAGFLGRMNEQGDQPVLRQHLGAGFDPGGMLVLHHADGVFRQIPDDGFHVPAHIAHLGELGGFHLDEGRLHQLGQTAGNFRFAHARGPDHQNVLGIDFIPHFLGQLGTAVAVAQGDGHRALGFVLADDVAVQLPHHFPGGHFPAFARQGLRVFAHAHASSTMMLSLVYTQIEAAMCSAFSAMSRALRSVFWISARAAARA